jgi:hypothetical protein
MLRIPHCLDNRHIDGGEVVSSAPAAHYSPETRFFFNVSGINLFWIERTPGPSAAGRIT